MKRGLMPQSLLALLAAILVLTIAAAGASATTYYDLKVTRWLNVTGTAALMRTNGVAAGGRGLYVEIEQNATALTGTLNGLVVSITNGPTAAPGGTVRGLEVKARAATVDGTGNTIGMLTGATISADPKGKAATTLRGFEVILSGDAAATSTTAQGVLITNESSGTQTNSYAIDINSGTATGHKAFTYDVQFQKGVKMNNGTSGVLGVSAASVQVDSQPVVLNTRHRVTTAEANAGHSLLPAIAGRTYRVVQCKMIAYGGAAATCTTVDILGTQGTSSVKLCAFAQASLAQSAVLTMGGTGAAVLADGASYGACDANTAITIGVTTNNLATATGVDVILDYTIE